METIQTHNVMDVADYIIHNYTSDIDGAPSNLKLNKLCYLTQGFSYRELGYHAFDEDVEAWQWGPVIRDVYMAFKHNGRAHITHDSMGYEKGNKHRMDSLNKIIPKPIRDIIDNVMHNNRDKTASQLSDLAHKKGTPWSKKQSTFLGYFFKRVIPKQLIKYYYTLEPLPDGR